MYTQLLNSQAAVELCVALDKCVDLQMCVYVDNCDVSYYCI